MAVELQDVTEVAKELQNKFNEFKEKNDKRLTAVEQEKSTLSGAVDTLSLRLNELSDLKSSLEKELSRVNRPERGTVKEEVTAHKAAFIQFLRKGNEEELRELQQKALQVSVNEDGGFAVPEELDRNIFNLLKDAVVMRQACTIITTGGSEYKKLVNPGGTNAGWVGETDPRATTEASKLTHITPRYGGILWLSFGHADGTG